MAARGDRFGTCSLCPRLCRHACPVATGSAREAAVPALIATTLLAWERGRATDADALEVATLCVDCGACRDACHLHVPLPEHLRVVRRQLAPPVPAQPLQPIEGSAPLVAVETDERPLARILERELGRPVARWPTNDRLGVASLESPGWQQHAAALRERVGAREIALADGGAAEALAAAGVAYVWANELLGVELSAATGSCRTAGGKVGDRPLACCGGAGPLARHHPDDARRVAHRFWQATDGAPVADARCRAHLRAAGLPAEDWLDHIALEEP